MWCLSIRIVTLCIPLLASISQVVTHPHLSDLYTSVEAIGKTSLLISRDASNSDPASYLFQSDKGTSIDEASLELSDTTSNQPTRPGRNFRTLSKSSSSFEDIPTVGLHLRSHDRSVACVNRAFLYAVQINATELLRLLLSTRDDLSAKAKGSSQANFYQFNHTNWSFNVAVANGTLGYNAILAVVSRFLRLFPSHDTPPIIWSLVGCVYDGGEPVANVAILPLNANQDLTSTDLGVADASPIPPTPVQVLTISPTGAVSSTEVVSSQALDVYKTNPPTTLPKRQMGGDVLRAFGTGLFFTVRILRGNDGLVHQATVALMITPILIALCKWALGAIAGIFFEPWLGDELAKLYRLESGSYRLGQYTGRFLIYGTARDREGRLVALDIDTYKATAYAIVDPLLQISDRQMQIYSMGGEVLGPDSVNGTGKTVILGKWELRVERNEL
ncbi:MAG: hypothetical protein L6R41_004911 [Letrouitia leprolyta]|nr:MAG: hypothetical protein L6R41_004911 [Letrouitia leprolyta]